MNADRERKYPIDPQDPIGSRAHDELMRVTGMGEYAKDVRGGPPGPVRKCIPAEPEYDTDIIIGEALRERDEFRAALSAKSREAEGYKAALADLLGTMEWAIETHFDHGIAGGDRKHTRSGMVAGMDRARAALAGDGAKGRHDGSCGAPANCTVCAVGDSAPEPTWKFIPCPAKVCAGHRQLDPMRPGAATVIIGCGGKPAVAGTVSIDTPAPEPFEVCPECKEPALTPLTGYAPMACGNPCHYDAPQERGPVGAEVYEDPPVACGTFQNLPEVPCKCSSSPTGKNRGWRVHLAAACYPTIGEWRASKAADPGPEKK